MSIRPRSITSLTLARHGQHQYQVTLWSDGLTRFDGQEGVRQGAWESHFAPQWFAWVAGLARDLEPGKHMTSDSPVTLIVETADNRFVYESGDRHEPGSFWLLGTAIDGLAQRVHWIPLDVTGANDFARWATGIPMWMSIRNAIASGIGAEGSIVVLAGSQASTTTSPSLEANYKRLRTSLIADDAFSLMVITSALLATSTSRHRPRLRAFWPAPTQAVAERGGTHMVMPGPSWILTPEPCRPDERHIA